MRESKLLPFKTALRRPKQGVYKLKQYKNFKESMETVNKKHILLFFFLLSLIFFLDKFILGPDSFIRIHDTLDSEFSRYKAMGELFFKFGLFGWYPNLAGGIPSYAYHFAPYYPLCLLSTFLPAWLIYSLMAMLLMLIAGYGMYSFLFNFLKLSQKACIAGGVLFALNTSVQGTYSNCHLVFNFAFPLFFMWTSGVFYQDRIEKGKTLSSLLPKIGVFFLLFISYPILTVIFFSLLQLMMILLLNPPPKSVTYKLVIQWVLIWFGYVLMFTPNLYTLIQHSFETSRIYIPFTKDFFSAIAQENYHLIIRSLSIFLFGGSIALLFKSLLLKKILGMYAFVLFIIGLFTSTLFNLFLHTFFARMDLDHFTMTVNIIVTIAGLIGVNLVMSNRRLFIPFCLGGVATSLFTFLMIQQHYPFTRYYLLFMINMICAMAVMFYCCSNGVKSFKLTKVAWVVLFILTVLCVRIYRFVFEENIPNNRFAQHVKEIREIIQKEPLSRIGSIDLPPFVSIMAGAQTVDGRAPTFYRPYKQLFGKLIEKQFQTKEERDFAAYYWYSLYLLNSSTREQFEGDRDTSLNLNIPLLLSMNVKYLVSPKPIKELALISSEVKKIEAKSERKIPATYRMIDTFSSKSDFLEKLERQTRGYEPVSKKFSDIFSLYVYQLRDSFDRAFLVDQATVLSSDEDVLEALSRQSLKELRQTVFFSRQDMLIPQESEFSLPAGRKDVWVRYYSPDKIIFDVQTDYPKFLVVSNNYNSKWVAHIDNQKTEVYRANHAFQAIYINSGGHREVILEYKDPLLWVLHIMIPVGILMIWLGTSYSYFKRKTN